MPDDRSILMSSLGGQEKLNSVLDGLLNWLETSFQINSNKGSSAYQNIWGHWSSAYPETTGYLIPTLLKSSYKLYRDNYYNIAVDQITYFNALLSHNNAIPCTRANETKYFFDNAQILLGLMFLPESIQKDEVRVLMDKLYSYLILSIENSGKVIRGNYKDNYTPSYYSRAAWPILLYESRFHKEFSEKALILLNYCASLKNKNHSFNDCSFDGSELAFTHTIIYSLRGLWESSLLTNDHSLKENTLNSVRWMLENLLSESDIEFYGSYDQNWQADTSFICSAGSSQFALLCLLIYKHTGESAYIDKIPQIMTPVLKSSKNSLIKRHYAIPSSIPVWQKYQRFRYTNWTQKFVVDFILELLDVEN